MSASGSRTGAITVEINGEYGVDAGDIHILFNGAELIMWDSAEWQEDPSLVFVIANAIRLAYEEGADSIRARLGRPTP